MVTQQYIIDQATNLRKSLASAHIPVERIILFGSYAKKTANEYSDIDLAIISNAFTGIRFHDVERLLPFLKEMDARVEVHPYRREDFDHPGNIISFEIKATGIDL